MSPQYGELRPTSGWGLLASLRHPNKFQRISRLCSVTARHCSSGRHPNFAALNEGRHLYSAGRPSRWALAHILVFRIMLLRLTFRSSAVKHIKTQFTPQRRYTPTRQEGLVAWVSVVWIECATTQDCCRGKYGNSAQQYRLKVKAWL